MIHHKLVKEKIDLSDEEQLSLKLGGIVRILSKKTGKVLVGFRSNIITQRGRLFALERVYNEGICFSAVGDNEVNAEFLSNINDPTIQYSPSHPIFSAGNPFNGLSNDSIRSSNRSVFSFCIGNGGTPVSEPFNPVLPSPKNVELASTIPFLEVETNPIPRILPLDIDFKAEHIQKYTKRVANGTLHSYYVKKIESGTYVINTTTNDIYKRLEFFIDSVECRNRGINELGLIISKVPSYPGSNADDLSGHYALSNYNKNYNYGGADVPYTGPFFPASDFALYSRITFPTQYLEDDDSLKIEYYTYA